MLRRIWGVFLARRRTFNSFWDATADRNALKEIVLALFQFLLGCYLTVKLRRPRVPQRAFNSFWDATLLDHGVTVNRAITLSIPFGMLRIDRQLYDV